MSTAGWIAVTVLICMVLLPIVWFVASNTAANDLNDPHYRGKT